MRAKPLKTALIGCGRIGAIFENDPLRWKPCTHFGGLAAARLKVHAACDINPERLRAFGCQAGIGAGSLYSDYRVLLRKERPDLVVIATWTESHAEIAIAACKAGARAVVCEKPIASNLTQASRLIREAEKHGVILVVNHERRFDRRYRAALNLLAGGTIGEVKTVHASILSGPYRGNSHIAEGGGPLVHDGTHMADILRYFFGNIESVRGEFQRQRRTSGYEDRAISWLKMKSGIDVFLEAGGMRRYFMFDLDISGTEGRIVIGNGYQRLYLAQKSRLYTGFRDLVEARFPPCKGHTSFTELYRGLRSALSGAEWDNPSTGEDGYLALEALHAVYYSAISGKRVDVPISPRIIDLKKIFSL